MKFEDLEAAEGALEPAWRSIENGDHKRISWENPHEALASSKPASDCPSMPPNECLEGQQEPQILPVDHRKLPLFLVRFCAAWVYAGMATVGVSILEKKRQYREAVERLRCLLGGNCCPSRRGYWWNRLVLNLEHVNRREEALEVGWQKAENKM